MSIIDRSSRRRFIAFASTLVVAGSTSGCAGGAGVIDAVTSSSSYVATTDVAYGEGPHRTLDVYRPVDLDTRAQAPVVVFFHGGSWREGSKADVRFVAAALTARGIVVVVPDYRLFPDVSYPSFLEDSAAAVAWTLRSIDRHGGDPSRVFVTGHSAGAYNAAMVAFDPRWLASHGIGLDRLRGFIGLAGPYDFLPIRNPDAKPVFHWPDTPPDSQPIHHITARSVPSLLIAAKHDRFVDEVQNTEAMARRMREAGVDVTIALHGAVDHITVIGAMAWPLRFLAPVTDEFVDFVRSHAAPREAVDQAARARIGAMS